MSTSHQVIIDSELENNYNHWLEHYTKNGDKHYSDTPDWKIKELYHDIITERLLNELPEMTDEQNDALIDRINNIN